MASGPRAGVQAPAEQGKRSALAGSRVREEVAAPLLQLSASEPPVPLPRFSGSRDAWLSAWTERGPDSSWGCFGKHQAPLLQNALLSCPCSPQKEGNWPPSLRPPLRGRLQNNSISRNNNWDLRGALCGKLGHLAPFFPSRLPPRHCPGAQQLVTLNRQAGPWTIVHYFV